MSDGLHGFTAVAELKRRGAAEVKISNNGLHGFTAVAELKRDGQVVSHWWCLRLHGFTAVAELKRKLIKHLLVGNGVVVSTASPPWPN